MAVGAIGPHVAMAAVAGDIVRIGYLATQGSVVRAGQWTPIVVDLRLENQNAFDGVLRLRQFDRDGDVYIDSVPVHLFGEGGAQRTYTLYTVANPARSQGQGFAVELLESDEGDESGGTLVEMISGGRAVSQLLPPLEPQPVLGDDLLVLSISDRPLGKIRVLLDPELSDRFARPVKIAHGAPSTLPEHWIGLEMIDIVLWDEADPTRLTDAQQRALVDWVREGGKLILAAGRTADTVAQAKHLGPLLPVKIGAVQAASNLPDVRRHLLGIADPADKGYGEPIAIARCELREGTDIKRVLYDEELGGTVIASRRIGRGHLVFVSADLRELLRDTQALPAVMFERLLELRINAIQGENWSHYALFPIFDRLVGFYGTSSLRLLIAILFAMAYVLLATLGAWKVLAMRNQLKHSWTVLGVLAAGASVLSIIGVQAVHGIGRKVDQFTIVDGVGDSVEAHATAYFGLTASTHTRLDVWLPENHVLDNEPRATACMLRPLLGSQGLASDQSSYTDPTRYRLRPATAEIHGVPVRATLKQFEGRWSGMLSGSIASSLATEEAGDEYRVSRGSWIRNDLGVDLSECYLLIAERDAFQPQRLTRNDRSYRQSIRILTLGTVRAGEQVDVYAKCYLDKSGKPIPKTERESWSWGATQKSWGRPFIRVANREAMGGDPIREDYDLRNYQYAALLETMLSEIDPTKFELSSLSGRWVFSRARLRQLDLSDSLTRESALLVGFSDDAGPVRLCVRKTGGTYEATSPSTARTVYRFVLPVEAPARKSKSSVP